MDYKKIFVIQLNPLTPFSLQEKGVRGLSLAKVKKNYFCFDIKPFLLIKIYLGQFCSSVVVHLGFTFCK